MFVNTRASSLRQNTHGLIGSHPWDGPGSFSMCQPACEATLMACSIKTSTPVL